MRIGFANIYSWRPHVEHLYYLAQLAEQGGHETRFLTCDSSVSTCYSRLIKNSSGWRECPKCMLGGVRSYPVSNITSISSGDGELDAATLDRLALSSSCTLTRIETESEWNDPEVVAVRERLHGPISAAYGSARRWIDRERLDSVILFNGRMDLTAGILLACEHAKIPYVTHERSWFGDGLSLNPNANCLSLKALDTLVAAYDDRPLTRPQAQLAGKLAAERFLQRNKLEWRVYNAKPISTFWPLNNTGPRVLVLPSSKNEFAGHPDWKTGWPDNTQALDDFFAAMGIAPDQVVLRCHPNWAETIGVVGGDRSLEHYRNWCRARNIHCISSEAKDSTYDLIRQADIVVLNGGSSAVEAGVCGKQVYSLGPSLYSEAGFVRIVRSREDLATLRDGEMPDPATTVRKTMRFLYLNDRRYPQFADHVRAIETTHYAYYEGADPDRLTAMIRTGEIEADDPSWAADDSDENEIVDALLAGDWVRLAQFEREPRKLTPLPIGRRKGLGWLDGFRARLPRGDRG